MNRHILSLLLITVFSNFAYSQNYSSNGNGDWTIAANWTNTSGWGTSTPPVSGGNGTWNLNHNQTISGNFQNGSSTLNIGLNRTLTITGNLTTGGGATINISGTLIVDGDIVLNSRINVLPGGKLIANGNVRVNSSDYLIVGTNVAPPPYADMVIYGDLNAFTSGDVIINRNGRAAVFGDINDNGGGGTILRVNNGGQLYVDGDINYSGGGSTIQNNNTTDPFGLYVNGSIVNSGGGSSTSPNLGDKETLVSTNPDFFNWVATQPNSPLPISLGSFSYSLTSSSVIIQFTTTKEENFSHFEIQRSRNGQSWDVIGEVIGNGNTSEVQAYGFEDRNPLSGISYYRLNAIDIDGTQEYHGMLSVIFQPGNHAVEVYPNPVTTGRFNIQANFELGEGAKIKVMDMVGAEILNVEFDGYQQEFTLPAKVREGLYVLIIQQDGLVYKKKLLVK